MDSVRDDRPTERYESGIGVAAPRGDADGGCLPVRSLRVHGACAPFFTTTLSI